MKFNQVLFYLFIFSSVAHSNLKVEEIAVSCDVEYFCTKYTSELIKFRGEYRSVGHLEKTLKLFLSRDGLKNISYQLLKSEDKIKVNVSLEPKKRIASTRFNISDKKDFDFIQTAASISVGDYYNKVEIKDSEKRIKSFLFDMGYRWNKVKAIISESNGFVNILYDCKLGPVLKLKNVEVLSNNNSVSKIIYSHFANNINRPFNLREIKKQVTEIGNELFNHGRYLLQVQTSINSNGVDAFLQMKTTKEKRYVYSFNGHDLRFNKVDYLVKLKEYYKKIGRDVDDENIIKALNELYVSAGYLNVKFEIKRSFYQDILKERVEKIQVEIKEGEKTRISNIEFKGNLNISDNEILNLYRSQQSELASLDIYDISYYNNFLSRLKKHYISKGFVQVSIQGPIEEDTPGLNNLNIGFQIQEGLQTYIESIELKGLSDEHIIEVSELLTNKINEFFDPLSVDSDLAKIVSYFQNKGYFNARILNKEGTNLVLYNKDKASVLINIDIELGKKIYRGDIIITGNEKTKKNFILKRIPIKKGEIISVQKVKEIQSALSSSGIFSFVKVEPIIIESSEISDLLITLTEKDSVIIELAPGFRSDLGLKLSGQVKFSNLYGMNRSVALKAQVNQRFNFSSIAPERRDDDDFIEYNTQIKFGAPDIYNSKFNFSSIAALTKKRFYSFDAKIIRGSVSINKDWTDYLSVSLRYQLEEIRQFNAVQANDNGRFQIGSLAPSLTLDFRDNRINPRKGSYFNLTWEFANPSFGSQDNDTQTIDYEKLMSRNRFYIPFEKSVLAIYTAVGVQKNLSENSGIPSIKLFRLTGTDVIRGYDDQEMNIAGDISDISEFDVTDKVYMSLFKIEPRFYMTDNFILGLFVDGGRLFVDSFRPVDVRSSVGISFKYLTPVGSLDFDYGHKISRGKLPDGTQESPGRLHVSIGFF